MRKPANDDFEFFANVFEKESQAAGKKQYLIPYYIASHPGSDLDAMINLAVFLKQNGYKPDQVQDFIPAPLDVATCMYYTGLDPFTKKPVFIAKGLRNHKTQTRPDAILQKRKLFRSSRSLARRRSHRPYWRRLRLPHPRHASQRSDATTQERRQCQVSWRICAHHRRHATPRNPWQEAAPRRTRPVIAQAAKALSSFVG